MTRKRFVKLLMSSGVSRNHANVCARRSIEVYGSYDKASAQILQQTLTVCVEGIERFKEMLLRIADAIAATIRQDEELAEKCLTDLNDRWERRYSGGTAK